jgi:hypothetical protein
VYDEIIVKHLASRPLFPNLKEIIVTGHSAGGQFTQRYAVATRVDLNPAVSQLTFRYIVSNLSSYLYLDNARWDGSSSHRAYVFRVPSTSCSYDDYKYGFDSLSASHYVSQTTRSDSSARFRQRTVVYLMGEDDTKVDSNLDTGCAASFQGPNRYQRSRIFFAYIDQRFAPHSHTFVSVAGVGHSSSSIYRSPAGVATLLKRVGGTTSRWAP